MKESYNLTKNNNTLYLTIKRKPNWFILIFTGLWLIGWIFMIGIFTYAFIDDAGKFDSTLIIFILFFLLGGLLILKIFLWHLRGREKITLDDKELIIEKTGTIITIPKKFEVNLLDYFDLASNPTIPKWIIFWGLSGGYIQFNYLGQYKYFGQTLSKIEAEEIIIKLNEIKKDSDNY